MVNPRFILGVAIFAIALVGGLLATWSVAVCTHGPREKTFAVAAFSVLWVLIFLDVVLAFWLPKPWCYVDIMALAPLAAIAAYSITLRSLLIREYEERHSQQEKGTSNDPVDSAAPPSPIQRTQNALQDV